MKRQAKVEIYYFGCCPWSYFFAYGGGFLDKEWTKTGGDFKEKLEKLGVEIVEINFLENPELVERLTLQIDPIQSVLQSQMFLLKR